MYSVDTKELSFLVVQSNSVKELCKEKKALNAKNTVYVIYILSHEACLCDSMDEQFPLPYTGPF